MTKKKRFKRIKFLVDVALTPRGATPSKADIRRFVESNLMANSMEVWLKKVKVLKMKVV